MHINEEEDDERTVERTRCRGSERRDMLLIGEVEVRKFSTLNRNSTVQAHACES